MKLSFYLLATLLLLSATAQATHIVGGELNYRCLGNNQYEISLTVFRDCQNGVPPFDAPASVGIFNAANGYLGQLLIPFMGDDTLQPTLFDSCLVIPPNVCVHRTTYIDTLTLPFLAGGYQLAYQRCCRNVTILNILSPSNTGATFYTQISEAALLGCNSNPVFNAWPPIYICVGEPIVFDHSATDIDGDSVVYELCAPFSGATIANSQPQPPFPPPYDSIFWRSPFSTTNMLGGSFPLKIDAQTGLLTGTPLQVGQYVVGVCVKEYRNGVLISSTKRDFQYNIGVCGRIHRAAFFTPSVVCTDNLTVNFLNQSTGTGTFLWNFGDPNSSNDTSILAAPTYSYSDTGQYVITLIAGVGEVCADTFSRVVGVHEPTLTADFDIIFDPCSDSTTVQLIDRSTNPNSPISTRLWGIFDGTTGDSSVHVANIYGRDFYTFALFVNSANGCFAFKSDTISTNAVNLVAEADTQDCRGREIDLRAMNLDLDDTLSYEWLPESEILSGQNTATATAEPIGTTAFVVRGSNQFGCTATDTVTVFSSATFPPLDISISEDSIFAGAPVQLSATFSPTYRYLWLSPNTLSNDTIHNPTDTPTVATTYILTIEDEDGCKNSDTVLLSMRYFRCAMPYIFVPNSFTPNGDGNNDLFYVRANSMTSIYVAVYNRWGQRVFETRDLSVGWDGTFQGQPLDADAFGYYLEGDCLDGGRFFQKGSLNLIR